MRPITIKLYYGAGGFMDSFQIDPRLDIDAEVKSRMGRSINYSYTAEIDEGHVFYRKQIPEDNDMVNDKYTQRQLDRLKTAGKAALTVQLLKRLREARLDRLHMRRQDETFDRNPLVECDAEFLSVIGEVFESHVHKALEESIAYLEELAALAVREHAET